MDARAVYVCQYAPAHQSVRPGRGVRRRNRLGEERPRVTGALATTKASKDTRLDRDAESETAARRGIVTGVEESERSAAGGGGGGIGNPLRRVRARQVYDAAGRASAPERGAAAPTSRRGKPSSRIQGPARTDGGPTSVKPAARRRARHPCGLKRSIDPLSALPPLRPCGPTPMSGPGHGSPVSLLRREWCGWQKRGVAIVLAATSPRRPDRRSPRREPCRRRPSFEASAAIRSASCAGKERSGPQRDRSLRDGDAGLREVRNPSALFQRRRREGLRAAAVFAGIEARAGAGRVQAWSIRRPRHASPGGGGRDSGSWRWAAVLEAARALVWNPGRI